jgi:hypothetical protein
MDIQTTRKTSAVAHLTSTIDARSSPAQEFLQIELPDVPDTGLVRLTLIIAPPG